MVVWSFTQYGHTIGSLLLTDTEMLGMAKSFGVYLFKEANQTGCILTTSVLKMAKTVSTFISLPLPFINEKKELRITVHILWKTKLMKD